MKTQRILVALTLVNFGLLVFQLSHLGVAEAKSTVPPMLRGRGMEIVDEQGRLRAQLTVLPGNESFTMPNGKSQPETVIFRLITADGKPRVKLSTSDHGSGLSMVGDSDNTYVILGADLAVSSLKLRNNEKAEQIIKP